MCQDTTTHTCTPSPTSLPPCSQGTRGQLSMGLEVLSLLGWLLALGHSCSWSSLTTFSRCSRASRSCRRSARSCSRSASACCSFTCRSSICGDRHRVWHRAGAEPGPPHTPCTGSGKWGSVYSRHRIIKIEVRRDFPVPIFLTLLQYSACLALKPEHSQWLQLQKGRWKPEELWNSSGIP